MVPSLESCTKSGAVSPRRSDMASPRVEREQFIIARCEKTEKDPRALGALRESLPPPPPAFLVFRLRRHARVPADSMSFSTDSFAGSLPPGQEPLDLVLQAPEIGTPELKHLARLSGATGIQALPRINHQAFRLTSAARSDAVAPFCAGAGIDYGFVPSQQRLDRVRLVAMDMDSTLITIECVDEIADLVGIKEQVSAITTAAMRGEVDFGQSLTQRVALLAGVDVSTLEQVYAQ